MPTHVECHLTSYLICLKPAKFLEACHFQMIEKMLQSLGGGDGRVQTTSVRVWFRILFLLLKCSARQSECVCIMVLRSSQ